MLAVGVSPPFVATHPLGIQPEVHLLKRILITIITTKTTVFKASLSLR